MPPAGADAPPSTALGRAPGRCPGYRLLLHLGQPKTATSTLQQNVLMPWHSQGRINFLGRCETDDGVHDPFEPVYDRIRVERLTDAVLDALRPSAEALVDPARLNVVSNERFGGMETVGAGAPSDADALLHNLSALFQRGDVRVLVSLRSPVDFIHSAYAESYYWRLRHIRRYDTFDKFLGELLQHGPGSREWLVCFADAWLRAVRCRFDNVEVLLYEDLAHDRTHYFARLADCLEANPAEVERMFDAERRNVTVRAPGGRLSRSLTLRERLHQVISPRFRQAAHDFLTRCPPLHRLYRRAGSIGLAPVAHRYPNAAVRRRVQSLLGLRDDYVTRAFGVSSEKLARHGYLRPGLAKPLPVSRCGAK